MYAMCNNTPLTSYITDKGDSELQHSVSKTKGFSLKTHILPITLTAILVANKTQRILASPKVHRSVSPSKEKYT